MKSRKGEIVHKVLRAQTQSVLFRNLCHSYQHAKTPEAEEALLAAMNEVLENIFPETRGKHG